MRKQSRTGQHSLLNEPQQCKNSSVATLLKDAVIGGIDLGDSTLEVRSRLQNTFSISALMRVRTEAPACSIASLMQCPSDESRVKPQAFPAATQNLLYSVSIRLARINQCDKLKKRQGYAYLGQKLSLLK